MAANPNEYDEDRYNQASGEMTSGVEELWAAGAAEDDIRAQFDSALKSAQG